MPKTKRCGQTGGVIASDVDVHLCWSRGINTGVLCSTIRSPSYHGEDSSSRLSLKPKLIHQEPCLLHFKTDTMSVRACCLSAILLIYLPLVSGHIWDKFLQRLDNLGSPDTSPQNVPQSIDEVIRKAGGLTGATRFRGRSGEQLIEDGMDMIVTPEQHEKLYNGTGSRGRSGGHNMMATPWTKGIIPYKIIYGHFDRKEEEWIRRAMRNWEKVTCVRFVNAMNYHKHRVDIYTGKGCSAVLGMSSHPTQYVNLEKTCFWKGLIEHELGHTIGLIHEHQRSNRDAYLRVDYFTMSPNLISAGVKYTEDADDKMGVEYDYNSVMHYGKNSFSIHSDRQTFYTRDPEFTDVIGMTKGPSFLDAKVVNLMYQCADRCKREVSCKAGCFVDQHCKCICEDNYQIKEHCEDELRDCEERAFGGECRYNQMIMHTFCRKSCGICNDHGDVPHLICIDNNKECANMAARGECENNPDYMHIYCKVSCGVCRDYTHRVPCEDYDSACPHWAELGQCDSNAPFMLENCRKSCDFCPGKRTTPTVREGQCGDVDTVCTLWQQQGKCYNDYSLMMAKCGKSCGACEHHVKLPEDCVDDYPEFEGCYGWARSGHCELPSRANWMAKFCKRSCNLCGVKRPDWMIRPPERCVDGNEQCKTWAAEGECKTNPEWMIPNCPLSCGACHGKPTTTPAPCIDESPDCEIWAKHNECEANPSYMLKNCKVSCNQCS